MSEQMRKTKSRKADGINIWFFLTHNLVSLAIFFLMGYGFSFFSEPSDQISYLFSINFFVLVLKVFFVSIFAGIIARLLSYALLKWLFITYKNKTIKPFGDLNQGINKMLSFEWLLSLLLSAYIFAIGLLTILQMRLFGELSLFSLLIVYMGIKVCIFLFVRVIKETKW